MNLPFLTVIVLVGTTEFKQVREKKGFTFDPVLAGFILGLFLYALNDAAPRIGQLFCILIIVTALILNGPVIFPALTPTVQGKSLVYFSPKTTTTKVA